MKILILQDDFPPHSLGGAGNVAFALARGLKGLGHEVAVVTATQDPSLVGESRFEGLRIFSVYSSYHERWVAYRSLYNSQTTAQVRRVLGEYKPEIVHAHNVHRHLSYYSLLLAKRARAKVFLTAHDAMLFHYGKLSAGMGTVSPLQQIKKYRKRYNPLRNFIIRRYLRYVDKIFAVSDALKEALLQNGIRNVEVMHNGIDVRTWEVESGKVEEFKNKFRLAGKKVILFGGRLSEAKGGEQAVRTLSEVVKKIPNTVLLIIGSKNKYAESMQALAHSLGVGECILFAGWVSGSDLRAAFAVGDVVCVPSVYLDPFPTVNLEAMACKKPVVGTCFGGTSEAVVDGATGYIVDPTDVALLADKVGDLLLDPLKSKRFGEAGYERVTRQFSLEKQLAELTRRYTLKV